MSITSEAARPPLFAALFCGCGASFEGNARTVPCFSGSPACRGCWDRINRVRGRLGLPVWGRPDCYPSDYVTGQGTHG